MMRMPDALPMHLMLAMMQSGILPNASMPWSNSFANFMPEWMRPKSPIEQASEQMQSLFQQASEQWLSVNPWLNQSAKNSSTTQAESVSHPFADFLNDFFNPDFLQSLNSEAVNRSTGFLQGIQAYLASDYERPEKEYDVLWSRGSAQLLDLAPDATDAVAVLCVPSLINKSTILDLYPEVSFVEFLKKRGFRPLILDWGSPNADECDFAMADYISFYALDALQALREQHDGPIALLGYCMGGIFTTAMAQLAAREVDALILLATPWDFSSKDTPVVLLNPATQLTLRNWIMTQYPVQPVVTQSIFHLIDPWRVQEKFSRYPSLSEQEKRHFLAVEQWVNDGVPLPNKVAEECFVDWPQGNILAKHQWKVGRRWIEPEQITCPTLAVIPTKDAIVPKGCATPLTKLLKRCDTLMPECGHVSMVVGKSARKQMWEPVADWLEEKF
jgi:polyhydroxyalkanoate synthase